MLSREQAQERLAKIHDKDFADRRFGDLKKLPASVREAGMVILGRRADRETLPHWNVEWNQARARAVRDLASASGQDRSKLFRLLLGDVATAAALVWDYLPRLCYPQGYQRKPFRISNRAEMFNQRRFDWLCAFVHATGGYRDSGVVNVAWLAAWAPYLHDDNLGILFAAVIDTAGKDADEVYDILIASAKNEHDVGSMGRHVTRALLTCAKPEAWEFVEKLLLAAQRQEGLRQVVLETVDEAHPEAFRRMLRLIIDNNLVRFSAVARAINVWFGFQWDSISTGAFNKILNRIVELLDSDTAREAALEGKDPEAVYFALWAIAHGDADAALQRARPILLDKKPEKRFAALTLMSQLGLPESRAANLGVMADDDLRIAVAAHRACMGMPWEYDQQNGTTGRDDDHFDRLEKLLERVPDRKTISMKPIIWPWTALSVDRTALLNDLLHTLGARPIGRVLKYLDEMDLRGRVGVALRLAGLSEWDAEARRTALEMAGDASSQVREYVLNALSKTRIGADEAAQLESYLTRKAVDLRRGVVSLLLSQDDAGAIASADRLLETGQANQRLAGLEVLRQLLENNREVDACRQRARDFQTKRRQIAKEEQGQLDAILAEKQEALTLDDALGLTDPAKRSPVVPPKPRKFQFVTPAAIACLQALDALAEQHKNEPVKVRNYQGEQEQLLGSCQWGIGWPDVTRPRDEELEKFPLRAQIEKWYKARPKNQRDSDGFELLRAEIWLNMSLESYYFAEWKYWEKRSTKIKAALQSLSGGQEFAKLQYAHVVQGFLRWLRFASPEPRLNDVLLDANETLLASLPTDEFLMKAEHAELQWPASEDSGGDWRDAWMFQKWIAQMPTPDHMPPPTAEQFRRSWALLHWFDQPSAGVVRRRPGFSVMVKAFQEGLATESDLLDDILGPRASGNSRWYYGNRQFESLHALTARTPAPLVGNDPRLLAFADRCRERILAIELARGETETPASQPATHLGALFGIDTLGRLMDALGKTGFKRMDYWRKGGFSKPAVLSALVRVTFPADADTPADFARRMHESIEAGNFPEDRLIELAFHAPQWAQHVADYYGWPGFQEGIWWFLAHMSAYVGDLGDVDVGAEPAAEAEPADAKKKPLSTWEKLIRQRTPLTDEERRQGAVDMAWFRRVYQELGDKHWRRMGDAAKWGAGSNRARKALHLGDVILGKANLKDLVASIEDKHMKESVRLLGIYPLPDGAKREKALDDRYQVLVDYRRYAKQLSAMSKPVAMQSAQIGLENLARTAGFPDPIRLEWAQEGKNLADIAAGPVVVSAQGVTASLFLDDQRQAQITIEKAGKTLKSLPPDLKKNEKFADLLERRTELRRQSARIKESLENAMCRGDAFTAAELRTLMLHPLLAPMIERLVLAGDGILGYPAKKGQALRGFAGKLEPIKKNESLRIAHPHDLLSTKQWHAWQRECFQAERVQPFKQVYRELYVVTRQEKQDGAISLRYNGQQVNPRQAAALFNARNWNTTEGIWKTFYEHKITATVWFKCGWGTPLEVEGWTLEGIEFRLQDELKPMQLDKVPPRLFSEVMRDLDLVVSVAHRGGVDPEASASTVEMRANLLRETCTLLQIGNCKIKDSHVLIDGKLGNYSVHLGSAVVHRRPGGAVCIVPVHAQHRGRLFLPFADDDPRTAEVISKVLLLARDDDIQDPTILEQLR